MSGADLNPGSLRLGFGCAGAWAKPWFSERKARGVLLEALENGVRHVDTAGFYAGGEGERRLGAVLREFREPVFVSTKTGTRLVAGRPPVKDFSSEAIRADVEASLRRLGRERIDLVYLHGPSRKMLGAGLETLAGLKKEGKVGFAGVCAQTDIIDIVVKSPGVEVVMAAYNVFRRGHATAFAKAKKSGRGVVAIAPLAQALYRRDLLAPRSTATLWAAARALIVKREDWLAARRGRALLENIGGWTPAQAALGFVFADKNVDVAVASTTKMAHLLELIAAADRPLPAEVLERLGRAAP